MNKPRIAFFGTPEFSAQLLEHIVKQDLATVTCVICQPDRPKGRTHQILPPPVKVVATTHGIPCLQPQSVKKDLVNVLSFLSAHGPTALNLVVAFGQILPLEVLEAATNGSCNIHASLLPRWRGAAPIQRAIQAGDTETGICLMKMDAGLDTGGVYVEDRLNLNNEETFATLHNRLCELSKSMLTKHLGLIAAGSLAATPQPQVGITYATKISNQEAHIDWSQSAVEIERTLRAFDPVPGAYTTFSEKRLKVFRGMVLGKGDESVVAGQVLAHDRSGVLVQCGDGNCLLLQEVQLEGKRRQNSHDFINGLTIEKGIVLK